jgi:hypothetical protein
MRYALIISTIVTLLSSFIIAKYTAYPYPYIFTVLSTATVMTVLLSGLSKDRYLGIAHLTLRIAIPKKYIYVSLVLSYVALLIARYLELTPVSATISLLFYFIVGYSIIELLSLRSLLDLLEIVLYSFAVGFTYVGVVAFVAMILLRSVVAQYILLAMILMHIILLFKQMSGKSKELYIQFNFNPDTLFKWITVFVIVLSFYALYYKDFVYTPGTDISRHYMHSVNVIRNPMEFLRVTPDHYYLFHSSVGALIALSGERDFAIINMLLIVVDIIYILSVVPFVHVVSGYGKRVDKSLTLLSTFIFTGLGWLYMLFNPPPSTLNYYSKLIEGNSRMYNNLMYAPSPFMWPVPLSFATATYILSLTLLFKILRSRENVSFSSKFSLSLLAILLTLAMFNTHPSEGIMYALILSFIILFTVGHREFNTMNSLIIGFIVGYIIGGLAHLAITAISPHPVTMTRVIASLSPALLIGSTWLLRKALHAVLKPLHWIRFSLNIAQKTILANTFLYLIIGLFVAGILTSLDMNNEFSTYTADPGGVVGLVPWFIYPVLLGFVLPLGATGIVYILLYDEDHVSRLIIKVLVLSIILSIIVGRTVSYLNISGINTGYWGEKRFVLFVYLALLPYAVYALRHLVQQITKMHISLSILATIALSFLVLISFSNTLVIASFWNMYTGKYSIDSQEYIALTKLRDIVWSDIDKWVSSPTIRSRDEVVFAAPLYTTYVNPSINFKFTLPETALRVLRPYGLETPYIYIDWRTDAKVVSEGWIGKILIPSIGIKILRQGAIEVYDIPSLTPVLPSSSTALIIPIFRDLMPFTDKVFLLISRLGLNYTTVLEIDPSLHDSYSTLILPYDPTTEGLSITLDTLSKELIGFWKGVSGSVSLSDGMIKLGHSEKHIMENLAIWRPMPMTGVETINVTLMFRIDRYDPNVLNYIYLVYDYKDFNNYKYLGIMLTEKGQVYVLNCSKIGKEYVCEPPWPGVYIGSNFDVSIEHRLNISFNLRDGIVSLKLDNFKPISFKARVSGGYIGVRVDRFHSITVEDFILTLHIKTFTLSKNFFKEILNNNKTVIVLNTMGYGDLYKMLKQNGFTTILRSGKINVYLSNINSSTIVYLDLKTSLDSILRDEKIIEALSEILHRFSDSFDVENYRNSIMLRANLEADNIACGNANIIAESIVLVPAVNKNLCLNSLCFSGDNVEYIAFTSDVLKTLMLKATNVSIVMGKGFYAIIKAINVSIPANTTVQLYLTNSSVLTFKLGEKIVIPNVTIIAKTPTIITNKAIITGVQYQSLRYPYLSKDLILEGKVIIRYVVGDNLLVLQAESSKTAFIESLEIYNELDSLPLFFKYGFICVLFLVLTFLVSEVKRYQGVESLERDIQL